MDVLDRLQVEERLLGVVASFLIGVAWIGRRHGPPDLASERSWGNEEPHVPTRTKGCTVIPTIHGLVNDRLA